MEAGEAERPFKEAAQVFRDLDKEYWCLPCCLSSISNIRKRKYSPATTTTTPATATVSRSGYPPWILKRGGLESSGRIPSS